MTDEEGKCWLVVSANPAGNPRLNGPLAGPTAIRIDDCPFPTVLASGVRARGHQHCYLEICDVNPIAGLAAAEVDAIAHALESERLP